jgi:hypothetical protein
MPLFKAAADGVRRGPRRFDPIERIDPTKEISVFGNDVLEFGRNSGSEKVCASERIPAAFLE